MLIQFYKIKTIKNNLNIKNRTIVLFNKKVNILYNIQNKTSNVIQIN